MNWFFVGYFGYTAGNGRSGSWQNCFGRCILSLSYVMYLQSGALQFARSRMIEGIQYLDRKQAAVARPAGPAPIINTVWGASLELTLLEMLLFRRLSPAMLPSCTEGQTGRSPDFQESFLGYMVNCAPTSLEVQWENSGRDENLMTSSCRANMWHEKQSAFACSSNRRLLFLYSEKQHMWKFITLPLLPRQFYSKLHDGIGGWTDLLANGRRCMRMLTSYITCASGYVIPSQEIGAAAIATTAVSTHFSTARPTTAVSTHSLPEHLQHIARFWYLRMPQTRRMPHWASWKPWQAQASI